MMKLLFICTANACRSIMAEAVARQLGRPDWQVFSAGVEPEGRVNPNSLAILEKHGIDTEGLHSKGYGALSPMVPDVVVTVCDRAAREPCPFTAEDSASRHLHWPIPDPALAEPDRSQAAFETACRRVLDLVFHLKKHEGKYCRPG